MGLAGVDEGLLPRPLKDHVDGVDTFGPQVVETGLDVSHLEREVMDPLATTLQELRQETGLSARFDELDLHPVRIAVLNEAKALLGNLHRPDELTTKNVAEHERCPFGFVNSNGHMIDSLRECQLDLTSKIWENLLWKSASPVGRVAGAPPIGYALTDRQLRGAQEDQHAMFTSIVVGTDGSATAGEAVRAATGLAKLCAAHLHVVSAYRVFGDMVLVAPGLEETMLAAAGTDDQIRAGVEAMLHGLAKEIEAQGVAVTTYASSENAAQAILNVAERQGADLIVVGNRGMRSSRPVLGGVPNNVVHHAPCSVLVVHTWPPGGPSTAPR